VRAHGREPRTRAARAGGRSTHIRDPGARSDSEDAGLTPRRPRDGGAATLASRWRRSAPGLLSHRSIDTTRGSGDGAPRCFVYPPARQRSIEQKKPGLQSALSLHPTHRWALQIIGDVPPDTTQSAASLQPGLQL